MAFNTAVILFTGVLILVYMVAELFGVSLRHSAVDALLYKNWFWWGLDLIADGLVLVNGELELRRGRKLRPGDRVEVAGRCYHVEEEGAR